MDAHDAIRRSVLRMHTPEQEMLRVVQRARNNGAELIEELLRTGEVTATTTAEDLVKILRNPAGL